MPTARIAFGGLSPLCEDILSAALRERPDLDLVTPWTRLPSLKGGAPPDPPEFLFVELPSAELPPALRVLLVAAEPLRVVGLSADARRATLFTIREQRTVLLDYSASQLWSAVADTSTAVRP
jgi:hypothetical protein